MCLYQQRSPSCQSAWAHACCLLACFGLPSGDPVSPCGAMGCGHQTVAWPLPVAVVAERAQAPAPAAMSAYKCRKTVPGVKCKRRC